MINSHSEGNNHSSTEAALKEEIQELKSIHQLDDDLMTDLLFDQYLLLKCSDKFRASIRKIEEVCKIQIDWRIQQGCHPECDPLILFCQTVSKSINKAFELFDEHYQPRCQLDEL